MTMLTKAAPFEVKTLDDKTGEIEGYGSTFGGEPDSYGDIVVKGAFTKTLAQHRERGTMPKMYWQHNPGEPIGRWLEAEEDDHGLKLRGRISLGLPEGQRAYINLKDGNIDGLSIGYRLEDYEEDKAAGVWYLKAVDLMEVSVVSVGANPSARASVKAARAAHQIVERLKAGERLTEREFETMLKGSLGFSNSEAERAARVLLKGQGEPARAANQHEDGALALLMALRA